jgi:Zn-dependent protease with chaperone function
MASVVRYRRMIERLEREARDAPGRYRFKLAMLAGLGFIVLGGSVALALGMSVGLVAVLALISPILLLKLIKVIWIPVAFGWFMLKSLWFKVEPPEGYHLREGEAPQLRAEIEWLRERTGAPELAGIIVDSQLNAAAASVPRAMGLLGHAHYLVIGLPLMQSLSREQFGAVVAHEFGHFGGGHGRFTGWIYRVRASWYRVLDGLAFQRSWTTKLFRRFFDWYAPFFDAYSFVLARANEYEADATSARVVGAPVAASALQRIGVCAARLDRDFWPGVQRSVQTSPQPPMALFREMATSFAGPAGNDAERLAELLDEKPGLEDTHPTLAQRLHALGQAPGDVAPPRRTAADSLLGPLQDHLEAHFSQQWCEGVGENWRERHVQHERDRARMSELAALPQRSAQETAEHARLVDDLCPQIDAVPLYLDALAANDGEGFVHYRLGLLLLDRDDPKGVVHLRRAMDLDPNAAEPALRRLEHHYRRREQLHELERVQNQLRALEDRQIGAFHARQELRSRDSFAAHGLDAESLETALAGLQRAGNVKQAWIVRKLLKGDTSGVDHFVVLVAWRGMVMDESSALQKVVDAVDLPGSFVAISPAVDRGVAAKVKKTAGEPTYGHR